MRSSWWGSWLLALAIAACGGKSQNGSPGGGAGSENRAGSAGEEASGEGGASGWLGSSGSGAVAGREPGGGAGAGAGAPAGSAGASGGSAGSAGSAGASGGSAGSAGASGGSAGSAGASGGCTTSAQCDPDHFCSSGACSLKAVQIASADRNTCVLLIDGSLRCWGEGSLGQLGNLQGLTGSDGPVRVSGLPAGNVKAVSVAVASGFACAALSDGTGRCWGGGISKVPTPLDGLPTNDALLKVHSGEARICGTFASGALRCWGTFEAPAAPPGIVPPITRLATKAHHSCLLSGQRVWCWGDNRHGQLGSDAPESSDSPVEVPAASVAGRTIVDLSVGGSHSCAAYDDGTVRCWGANFSGQLGVTGVTQSSAPLLLPAFPLSGAKVTVLSAGPTDTCAILEDHSVRCWGGMYGPPAIDSAAPVLVAGLTDGSLEPVALSRGAHWQACVLLGDGSVRCWGTNLSDALGAGYGASSGVQRVAPW